MIPEKNNKNFHYNSKEIIPKISFRIPSEIFPETPQDISPGIARITYSDITSKSLPGNFPRNSSRIPLDSSRIP